MATPGKYENFEVGLAAVADEGGFSKLDEVFGQMKKNVANLKAAIDANEVKRKKILNQVGAVSQRHARVAARLTKREAMAKEYRKTIDAVEGGYNGLLESSNLLLEVLQAQMQASQQPHRPEVGDEGNI